MLGSICVLAGTAYFGLRAIKTAKDLGMSARTELVKTGVQKALGAMDTISGSSNKNAMKKFLDNATPEELAEFAKVMLRENKSAE